jgi:hypothetical protein
VAIKPPNRQPKSSASTMISIKDMTVRFAALALYDDITRSSNGLLVYNSYCLATPTAWTIIRSISSVPDQRFQEQGHLHRAQFEKIPTLAKSSGVSVSLSALTLRSSKSANAQPKAEATRQTYRSSRGNWRRVSNSGSGSWPCMSAAAKFRYGSISAMLPVRVRRVLDEDPDRHVLDVVGIGHGVAPGLEFSRKWRPCWTPAFQKPVMPSSGVGKR